MADQHILRIAILCLAIAAAPAVVRHAGANTVYVTEINAPITPVIAKYIVSSITDAEEAGAECLVLELDTPGGLDQSMRQIVKRMQSADVPVVVFVYPAGSRAASAGVWITLASHVAVMAPGTDIGAAHPVMMGGMPGTSKEDKGDSTGTDVMEEKVVNEAAANIRSIAEKNGRNADWAEEAVRKSVAVTAKEALKLGVIDYVCENLEELMVTIDSLEVQVASGKKIISTTGATVERLNMNLRYRLLNTLSNPSFAYILLMLGIYGIFFELYSPGTILPGVVGGICIIVALFSLHMLPINYAGLVLILLAIIMFIAEIKITSYGLLTVGGAISMFLGSIMLVDSPIPFLQISWIVIVSAVLVTVMFFLFVVGMGIKAQRRKPILGKEATVGSIGIARTDIDPRGQVFIEGELWTAFSSQPIKKGEKIRAVRLEHMQLEVESVEQPNG